MNYQELKNAITEVIRTNGNEEITGEVLQFTLLEMVSSLGKDFQFAGVATPQTAITERDDKVAWVLGAGTYENFGIPFTVGVDEIAFVLYNGSYSVQKLKVGVVVDDTLTRDGQNPVKGGAIYAEFEKLRAAGYIFAGVTTPAGVPPQNLTEKIFYLCKEGGTYTNFGNLVLQNGLSVLKWNGSLWSVDLIFGITDEVTENLASLLTSAGAYLAISAEATLREQGDGALRQEIADEVLRAQDAEQQNANDIDALEALVPSQASPQNKLVDEQKMNSSIGTATATYRGAYNLVSDLSLTVEATHADIEAALALKMTELSITPDNNDYAFVQVPTSDETPTQIERVERYKFNGTVWLFEYALNNSGFTAEQWAALNSGITSGLVTKLSDLPTYAELMTLFGGKQDTINDLSDIRSGAAKGETAYQKPVGGIPSEDMSSGVQSSLQKAENAAPQSTTYNKTEVDGMIGGIEEKIPSGASAQNKLVDQQKMNSSIATATATYRGAYNLVSDLSLTVSATEQQIAAALATKMAALSITPDNNDYCYVQVPTSDATPTQIARVDRYKYNGTAWGFEYSLNNSGFTAAQWAALNSGITSGLVAKLSDLPSLSELTALLAGKANTSDVNTALAGKQNIISDLAVIRSGAALGETAQQPATTLAGYGITDAYTKSEVDALAGTPVQNYVTVTATAQTTTVASLLPATGSSDTLYTVGCWDGTQYDAGKYSQYKWNGSSYVMIATHAYPGVESTPTIGSQKLVTSDGIAKSLPATKDVVTYDAQGLYGKGVGTWNVVETPVKAGTSYIAHPSNDTSARQFAVWSTFVYENGQIVEKEQLVAYTANTHRTVADWDEPVAPQYDADGFVFQGYANMYIDIYHNTKEAIVSGVNTRWQGKKWLLIGDSISTEQLGVAEEGYGHFVSKSLGMEYTNVALSGKVMSYYYDLIDNYSNDFDLITVMLGANNMGYNTSIGELNDQYYQNGEYNTNNSFYAQTQLLYEKLHAKYPRAVIMFATTIKRSTGTDDTGYSENALGLTTKAYADVIKNVCDWYSIPCIDIFNSIDPRTQANRTLYFMSANDGTHPNELGHALFIAPIFEAEILKHAKFFIQQ